jgi:heptosyltransferase-1
MSGLPLVLNGAPRDREILQVHGCEVHISSIAGLIDATRRATAVVGLDSGPMHLAAALGRPGVALFGPTDPGATVHTAESFGVFGMQARSRPANGRGTVHPSMRAAA